MQKELHDPGYWKNMNRMKFTSMKYMDMHLGINNIFFFSKSRIHPLEMTEEENLSLRIIDNYVPSRYYDHEKDKCDLTKYHLKHFRRRQAGISNIVQGQGKMSSEILYIILITCNQEKMHSSWNRLEKGT